MEFAVVLILLVIIVFGITELGRALNQENTLAKAVNIGARYIARQPDLFYPAGDGCGIKGDWSAVKQDATNLIICGQKSGCSAANEVVPGLATDGEIKFDDPPAEKFETATYNGETALACRFTVTATVPFQPIFGDVIVPFTDLTGFNLNARTQERYIGE